VSIAANRPTEGLPLYREVVLVRRSLGESDESEAEPEEDDREEEHE
jgi:hypothetical protein